MYKSTIKDVVLAVTYRCNSRCRMCNIWKRQDFTGEFKPEDLNNLPADLRDINLTGGEPFLRPDLPEIVKVANRRCPKAKIVISSNGFASELIAAQMEKILAIKPDIGVAISLDGAGEAHDRIRGIDGGFDKVRVTLDKLKRLGVKNMRLAFTQGDYNIGELDKVYKLAEELGLELSLAMVHSGENYFGKENVIGEKQKIINEFDRLIKKELSGFRPKHWARAYFTFGLIHLLKTGKRLLPDYSGRHNLFIDPFGRIYPCDVADEPIGELKGWRLNPPARPVHGENWMICTARPAIKKHWLRAGWWVVINKTLKSKTL